jgi:hypothetical protein
MIPSFIKLLEDKFWAVRLQSLDCIGKLANHGERQLERIEIQLNRTTKPSFVKPYQK